jgi:hypothetical protein
MTVYSYSRVSTYFNCPAQFEFRYVRKIPSPAAEGVELFLGSRFHETMEFLYQQMPRRIPTVNEIMDYFKSDWETHWKQALQKQKDRGFSTPLRIVQESQTIEDYFQKGQLFVENYYHKYHPFDQDATEAVELKVAFDLDSQKQYKMQGFLDRLARDSEGTLWIHDYKTSSRKMSAEDARYEDQLALYQIGLQQNPKYGPQEKVKLAWHFVAFENDVVVSERNPKEIEWLKQKYVGKIQTIEKAKSFPTKTSVLCQWCEYLTVCVDGKNWVETRKGKPEAKEKLLAAASPTPSLPEGKILSLAEAPLSPPVLVSKPSAESVPAVFPSSKPKKKKSSLAVVSSDQLSLF